MYEALSSGLDALPFRVDQEQRACLFRYLQEIELWNPRLKLISATGDELVVRHILDSLAPLPHFAALAAAGSQSPSESLSLADLGSGAGLPGIPLAVALPQLVVTLVERGGRRAGFLRNAVAVLKLSTVEVVEADAFSLASGSSPRWRALTARAFLPLTPDLLDAMTLLAEPGGTALLYKGRRAAIEPERLLCEQHPGVSTVSVEPVVVPQLREERHLLIIRFA